MRKPFGRVGFLEVGLAVVTVTCILSGMVWLTRYWPW